MSESIQAGNVYRFNQIERAKVLEIEGRDVLWRDLDGPKWIRRVPLWFFRKHAMGAVNIKLSQDRA